jgi:hypothetical protein
LKKDYPDAPKLLDAFAQRAAKAGYLQESFAGNTHFSLSLSLSPLFTIVVE